MRNPFGICRRRQQSNIDMKHHLKLFAVASLVAVSTSGLQAQSRFVAGAFNGWDAGANQMTDVDGGNTNYTYDITGGTAGNLHEWKITDGTFGTTWPANNVKSAYGAGGSNTVYFRAGTIADGWQPGANRVGYEDPGQHGWEIIGAINDIGNGWDEPSNSAARQMVDQGNGLYSVNYTIAKPPGTYAFKFRQSGSWDINIGNGGFGHNAGDAQVTTLVSNEAVTFQLDLPNGRWRAGIAVTNLVTFTVDMQAAIAATGNNQFDPDFDSVYVRGDFNGWPGTVFPDLQPFKLQRVGTTSVYTNTVEIIAKAGTTINYKFYADAFPSYHEEITALSCGGARTLQLTTNVIGAPAAYWNDSTTNDPVSDITLQVDMAVQIATGSFLPGTDNVYARGEFNNWSDPGLLLTNLPAPDTNIYAGVMPPAGLRWPTNGCRYLKYKFLINGNYETIADREVNADVGSTVTSAFNNLDICDVVESTNFVTFSVNMSNAVGYTGSPVYDGSQTVYINGDFVGWKGQVGDTADWGTNPKPELMLTKNPTSDVHSVTLPLPPGQNLRIEYKYTMGGEDNEAGGGLNHVRYIRTAPGQDSYALPLDNWTGTNANNIANLQEPQIGYLTVTAGSGEVQLQWLGLKCAGLQTATSVTGPWTPQPATDGLNSTNLPTAADSLFIRVAKPNTTP